MPATTVDAVFDNRPDWFRDAFARISRHVERLGPVVIEPVTVGVFIKRRRTFAELRPRVGRLEAGFLLSRTLESPRVSRTVPLSANRVAHFVLLTSADDVDDGLLGWLAEAYDSSPV